MTRKVKNLSFAANSKIKIFHRKEITLKKTIEKNPAEEIKNPKMFFESHVIVEDYHYLLK